MRRWMEETSYALRNGAAESENHGTESEKSGPSGQRWTFVPMMRMSSGTCGRPGKCSLLKRSQLCGRWIRI